MFLFFTCLCVCVCNFNVLPDVENIAPVCASCVLYLGYRGDGISGITCMMVMYYCSPIGANQSSAKSTTGGNGEVMSAFIQDNTPGLVAATKAGTQQ